MRTGSGGFGLIDVLLTVTILGILAGVGVSMLENEEFALDAAARAVAADMLVAQQLAIETRTPLGLAIDPATDTTWFVLGDGTKIPAGEAALRASTLSAREVERLLALRSRGEAGFAGIVVSRSSFGGGNYVVFETDGSPRASGACEVARGATWLRVHCQAASGRVTVTAP